MTLKSSAPQFGCKQLLLAFLAIGTAAASDSTLPQKQTVPKMQLSAHDQAQLEWSRQQFERFQAKAKANAEARRLSIAERHTRMVPEHLRKQYDVNNNGIIDDNEWQKYSADLRELLAARAAANSSTSTSGGSTPTKP
jgi:hypothetical protein